MDKDGAECLFAGNSTGIATGRDAWVINQNAESLSQNMIKTITAYNVELSQWIQRKTTKDRVGDVLDYDDTLISWSSTLKSKLRRGIPAEFDYEKIRTVIYRPFIKSFVYYDSQFIYRPGRFEKIFPLQNKDNQVICLPKLSERPFCCLMSQNIVERVMCGGFGSPTQCFPYYIYNADGTNRRENITDWAPAQFRTTYAAAPRPEGFNPEQATAPTDKPFGSSLDKWHIFHYIYALLHHPTYRETYAANLRRELPRIPFIQPQHFWHFVQAGQRLAEIHVHYEAQPEHPLSHMENPDEPLNYRVEKMRLSKDKTSLKVNDFLTLGNIPPAVFDYKLGNRSALDWVIDQYRVKTDKRSGITNDPNNLDDETYILRLIKQVITVSLETVEIVNNLPPLDIIENADVE